MKKKKQLFHTFAKDITAVIGLVLVWRGIWYALDGIDRWMFGGSHFLTAIGSVIIGLSVLYLPDRNLKEIEKL